MKLPTPLRTTLFLLLAAAVPASAQTFGPAYAPHYTLVDLGPPPGVPTLLGGLTFRAADAGKLLIAGDAELPGGAIFEIDVVRDAAGHVTGFSGSASQVSTAPFIDGGLTTAPGDVLVFTTWPTNMLGQVLPGSTTPDKMIDLTALGVTSSTGTIQLVPAGFAGARRAKLMSWESGAWYDARLAPDGSGTFDLEEVAYRLTPAFQPEGIAFVGSSSPGFTTDSVLIASYAYGAIMAFEIDSNGDPLLWTAQHFLCGLGYMLGSAVDPLTGDLFYTGYTDGRVYAVRGFEAPAPEVYCTAKLNSCGSLPAIAASGTSSAGATSGFNVFATNTRALKFGLLLYTSSGRGNQPFGGGLLCLGTSPLKRSMPVADTTGTSGACDGTLSIDMNAFASGNLGGTPLAALRVPGTRIDCQFWGRDTTANGALLSDALEYYVRP